MNDLAWGMVVQAGLWLLAFGVGLASGHKASLVVSRGLVVVPLAMIVAQPFWVADNLGLAVWLPFSNLIVLANLIPAALGFLAGLSCATLGREPLIVSQVAKATSARRVLVMVAMFGLSAYSVVHPILGVAPRCVERWDGPICLQTTESSCTAACAVTLLRAHGIAANEQEMAELCLTREGTLWLGLYRGLKLKTAATSWDVEVVGGSFEQLLTTPDVPIILDAGIPPRSEAAAIKLYTERYGWAPGAYHSVLFFGTTPPGLVSMADPSPGIGLENWTQDDLKILWRGHGLRLIRHGRSSRFVGVP